MQFESDQFFHFSDQDFLNLAAHLPGMKICDSGACVPNVVVSHIESKADTSLLQTESHTTVSARWEHRLPEDFIHLMYGMARKEWLRKKIFPVHAACIGNEKEGYILLVGPPGAGKTSLTLESVRDSQFQLFSGDKTLVTVREDGALEAIAGTRTLTVRSQDMQQWRSLEKRNLQRLGDRFAFELAPSFYAKAKTVPIRKIVIVGFNNGFQNESQLNPLSALHTLYPFFMDKQREDVLIGGSDALLDGTISVELKSALSKNLSQSLDSIPVFKISGPLSGLASFIRKPAQSLQQKNSLPGIKKILFGICGIGNGHLNRQLPILERFLSQGHQVLTFTYGKEALDFLKTRFSEFANLTVVEVANPYFVGDAAGLNFHLTAHSEKNNINFNKINSLAMDQANKILGTPDLVISDYELVSAQYAYAKRARFVTLNQQSKFLQGAFPSPLQETTAKEEVERLSLFFPKADRRIAISFFKIPLETRSSDLQVDIYPPMIRPELISGRITPQSLNPSLLIYFTKQQMHEKNLKTALQVLQSHLPKSFTAHIFLPEGMVLPDHSENLFFYRHNDSRFDMILLESHGVIATAGHTLLSEAMYLEKPVYALPLPLYEQQLNARIIMEGGFGYSEPQLSQEGLQTFLHNLAFYKSNIQNDSTHLFKGAGNQSVIEELERILYNPSPH